MSKQLERLAEFEKEKEQREARFYQQAQLNVNQQKQKLSSLEQYRVDYIKGIQQTGQSGVTATYYQQHLSFVGKLDKACEQQMHIIRQAKVAADQQVAPLRGVGIDFFDCVVDGRRLARERGVAPARLSP